MPVRKTSLAVDEELLSAARAILGTTTTRETVEKALLEVVRAQARERELERLSTMDGIDLDDPSVMSGAWR